MENVKELIKQKEQVLLKEKKDLIEACLYALELAKMENVLDGSSYYINKLCEDFKEKLQEYESRIIDNSVKESEVVEDESN